MTHRPNTDPQTTSTAANTNEQADQELVMYLERDQLVADTSIPLPRAQLSQRANSALWALRLFVILVSIIVIYTFTANLK
jgi:uncharacterized membrane protein YgcG